MYSICTACQTMKSNACMYAYCLLTDTWQSSGMSHSMSFSMVMMIAFTTFNNSLLPLIENVCSSNPWEFEFLGV